MASQNVIELTTDNWDAEIKSGTLVVADFWAPWCGPCRQLSPVIDRLADQFAGKVKVGKVNVDENGELAMKYDVATIPRVMMFKGGEQPVFLTIVEVEYKDGPPERYLLPLAMVTRAAADGILAGSAHLALARITGARQGLVVDGTAGDAGAQTMLESLESPEAVVRMKHGTVRVRRAFPPGPLSNDERGSRLILS